MAPGPAVDPGIPAVMPGINLDPASILQITKAFLLINVAFM